MYKDFSILRATRHHISPVCYIYMKRETMTLWMYNKMLLCQCERVPWMFNASNIMQLIFYYTLHFSNGKIICKTDTL